MLRTILFAFFFLIFILCIDIYAFQAVRTATRDSGPRLQRIASYVYWGVTIITILTMIIGPMTQIREWPDMIKIVLAGIIIPAYFAKAFIILFMGIDDLIRLGQWLGIQANEKMGSGNYEPDLSRKKFISQLAVGLAVIPFFTFIHGIVVNAYNYKVHKVKVKIPNLPKAFEGLKIIHLSDIHSGSFTQKEPVIEAVEQINKLNADIIFFTGDIVNSKSEELKPYVEVFGKLKARLGVFSVTGNHDHGDYFPWPNEEARIADVERLLDMEREMGWKVLIDENIRLTSEEGDLAIIGIQNWSAKGRFKQYGDLSKAYQGSESAKAKILLSHDPSHWDAEVRDAFPDIDLQLSGHTHGAQFGVENKLFRWSPAKIFYKQWAGLYQEGKQQLYVNRGFGFIGYPGRVGILPEIAEITLHCA